MIMQILSHTPTPVFVVFGLLLWLGARQVLPGQSGPLRAIGLPFAFMAGSAYSISLAFPHAAAPLLAWLAGLASGAAFMLARGATPGSRYDAASRRFRLPGSFWPLFLLLGIFGVRYAMAVSLALHPALRAQPPYVLGCALACGFFAGCFGGRALNLVKLAWRERAFVN